MTGLLNDQVSLLNIFALQKLSTSCRVYSSSLKLDRLMFASAVMQVAYYYDNFFKEVAGLSCYFTLSVFKGLEPVQSK